MENAAHAFPTAARPPQPGDAGRLAQDFRTFVGDVEGLLKNAQSLSGDGMNVARAKLDEKVAQAKVKLEAARVAATEQAGRAVEATEGYVRREPIKAIGIAAAVGAVIGLLLARR